MSEIELPNKWQTKKLGEVCRITYGKGLPTKDLKENGFPVFGANGIIGFNDKYLYEESQVLISCRGAYSGKINFSPPLCFVTNNSLILEIISNEDLDKRFLYYILHTVNKSKLVTGTAQPQVTINNAVELTFQLPQLETQHAIVSKIEELFSELDQGISDLKTAQAQLKVYRQSVLNLLATNENLTPIEKIISKLDQGWSPKCENNASVDKTQWAVIKTSAVQKGYFVEIENKILPNNLIPKEQHEIEVGDILITRAGPRVRVGICCMVKHTRPKLINCDKVYRIKVNKELILPEYFEYIINTPKYQDIIEKMKSGISDSGLNLTQKVFVNITIPLPPIEEQHHIVQEIESRLSVADKMEESIQESLQKAEALRQSILKKAFSGELV